MFTTRTYYCTAVIGNGEDFNPYRPKFADFDSVVAGGYQKKAENVYDILVEDHTELLNDPDIEVSSD